MDPFGSLLLEGDSGAMGSLVPSPQSDAVTHDLEELSLQPVQSLPPLKERKNVLQLRLQQRRTREQLAAQGIMPPLKTPAVFHEQVRSLERARTENFLKHKIRSRPKRAELVRMHILQETQAEPSLQATQMKLKRARLADDLNEKIAQRPGPMELVVKNILPVDSTVTKAIIDNDENSLDVYKFEEDSSDALSPEQPASHESQSSASSPVEARMSDISSISPSAGSSIQLCPPTNLTRTSVEDQANSREKTITAAAPTKPGPTLVKQSQPKPAGEKSRSKKSREPKPRVRRLKYHQYIPPDQKQEPNEAPMDSAYARLLQQQQQFLQLQIISQQQQHYNYQAILPAPLKPVAESQNGCPNVTLTNSPSLHTPFVVSLPSTAPSRPNNTVNCRKPNTLPSSLDEMKVPELKRELKLRGLPVSGTKTDLIERLKARQETSQLADANISKSALQPDGMSTTPPVSPERLEASSVNMEENKEAICVSPLKHEDVAMETKASEKDQRLHEKERQIEELMRKLEQEQRLVEELKMQLEVEKRSQQTGGLQPEPESPVHVKDENGAAPSCNFKTSPLRQSTVVKQEESRFQMHHTPVQQYYINAQQVPNVLHQQTEAMINTQPATQILLPLSLPNSISLTSNPITTQAQSILQSSVPALAQSQQHSNQTQTSPQALSLCASSTSGFEYRQNQNQSMAEMPQCFLSTSPRVSPRHTTPNGPINKPPSPCQISNILQPSTFTNHHSPKSKDPPRYEEAVKQTRGLQASMQVPTATSQHMDDLFDILIESGEISPMTRQDPSLDKHLPVTANITTLPINTVLSRPPPQIHVARTPNQPQVALASDNQLEALLGETEPRTLRLIEELKSQLLDQPHSPMDTSDLTFSDAQTPALHLQDTGLDMEWLDLTIPGTAGISSPAVFSSDFLDSPDLQLHWD
ncbi:myocardin-related transcription factor B isoform X1 [Misgurnus anguillicaudatus]|uniref:myocardin-related transcription factor B isoform X1 n=1 Tax=Misgurnus anguillicaudatus TaxID=75329 RepID=UPI003CCFDDCD